MLDLFENVFLICFAKLTVLSQSVQTYDIILFNGQEIGFLQLYSVLTNLVPFCLQICGVLVLFSKNLEFFSKFKILEFPTLNLLFL